MRYVLASHATSSDLEIMHVLVSSNQSLVIRSLYLGTYLDFRVYK